MNAVILVGFVLVILVIVSFFLEVDRRLRKLNKELAWLYDKGLDRVSQLERDVEALKDKVSLLVRSSGGFWETGMGAILRIRDMTDSHLQNALAWLKENHKNTADHHSVIAIRGEMARRRHNDKMELGAPVVKSTMEGVSRTCEGQRFVVEMVNTFMVFRNAGSNKRPDFVARANSLDDAQRWCP